MDARDSVPDDSPGAEVDRFDPGDRHAVGERGIRLDARAVRVLAHPLRSRLLSRLRLDGPATATELATALGTNTGATSYHLRELEGVGLVADTGRGTGRRRVWEASSDFHSWFVSDFPDDPDARAALGWLTRDYIRQFADRAERWEQASEFWPAEWSDRLGMSDSIVLVTPEQAGRLGDELDAVIRRFREAGRGDPRARRLHVTRHGAPVDLDPPDPPR